MPPSGWTVSTPLVGLLRRVEWCKAQTEPAPPFDPPSDEYSAACRCLHPALGKRLLTEHDGGGDALRKPVKAGLLADSTTGSSGAEWRRQRTAVDRAFGGSMGVQRRRHGAACDAAASTVAAALERDGGQVVDARAWAASIAARAMAVAVAGDGVDASVVASLEAAIGDAFDERLLARKGDAARQGDLNALGDARGARRRALGEAIDEAICATRRALAARGDEEVAGATLLQRIVQESELLSESEMKANIASAIYAGFQATALLLLTAVLELAARPALQERLAREATASPDAKLGCGPLVQAVLRETLRVYPPIAGLPRVTLRALATRAPRGDDDDDDDGDDGGDDDGDDGDGDDGGGGPRLALGAKHYVVVDLIAAAHGRQHGGFDTFRWDPQGDEPPKGACPFGLGARACPAGSLTLVLVGRALHALASEATFSLAAREAPARPAPRAGAQGTWRSSALRWARFVPARWPRSRAPLPHRAGHTSDEHGGREHPYWRGYLHYGPTLCCTAAVPVCFAPRTRGATADPPAPREELGLAAEVNSA